mgnify:CR=1 FL=1
MAHRVKLSDVSPHLYGFDENGTITDQMVKDWPEWEFIRDVFREERTQYNTRKSDLQRLTEFMNTEAFECDVARRYPFLKPNPKNAEQKGYLVDPDDKVSYPDFIIETPEKTFTADLKYHKEGMKHLPVWNADIAIYYTVGRPYEFCIKKTGQMGTLDQLEEVLKNGLN